MREVWVGSGKERLKLFVTSMFDSAPMVPGKIRCMSLSRVIRFMKRPDDASRTLIIFYD